MFSDDHKKANLKATVTVKRAYSSPKLTSYGQLCAFTAGGSSGKKENHPNNPGSRP